MIRINSPDFNIDQIADSGQCFRIRKISPETRLAAAGNRFLRIHAEENGAYVLECSPEEYREIWFDYFDMQRDYAKIKKEIKSAGDAYLAAAVDYGGGIRILRQNPWETAVTFIISQRNNIPRIKSIIERLCEPCGGCFPSPDLLAKYTVKDFLSFGLGYRAEYLRNISEAVVNGELNFETPKRMSCRDAVNFLKKFKGIGDKVANCIALFGLHKTEAFPIDVWIRRIADNRYGGTFDTESFRGYAGIVQQYMFFYERSLSKNAKPKDAAT
ncbi:MAG: hypothetical protein LBO73_03755 [Holosporaceae bacterium]|jgi:N-glycosylase/DNA lyase|nr:hypothetical protein [Holosporaceae bacterium]